MDFSGKAPIYIQIMNLMKRRIITGELKIGEKMPSVRDLSIELAVNPNTVQRAYQELERENLTFTLRGRGNFIVEDEKVANQLREDISEEITEDFLKEMKSIGLSSKEILGKIKYHIGVDS